MTYVRRVSFDPGVGQHGFRTYVNTNEVTGVSSISVYHHSCPVFIVSVKHVTQLFITYFSGKQPYLCVFHDALPNMRHERTITFRASNSSLPCAAPHHTLSATLFNLRTFEKSLFTLGEFIDSSVSITAVGGALLIHGTRPLPSLAGQYATCENFFEPFQNLFILESPFRLDLIHLNLTAPIPDSFEKSEVRSLIINDTFIGSMDFGDKRLLAYYSVSDHTISLALLDVKHGLNSLEWKLKFTLSTANRAKLIESGSIMNRKCLGANTGIFLFYDVTKKVHLVKVVIDTNSVINVTQCSPSEGFTSSIMPTLLSMFGADSKAAYLVFYDNPKPGFLSLINISSVSTSSHFPPVPITRNIGISPSALLYISQGGTEVTILDETNNTLKIYFPTIDIYCCPLASDVMELLDHLGMFSDCCDAILRSLWEEGSSIKGQHIWNHLCEVLIEKCGLKMVKKETCEQIYDIDDVTLDTLCNGDYLCTSSILLVQDVCSLNSEGQCCQLSQYPDQWNSTKVASVTIALHLLGESYRLQPLLWESLTSLYKDFLIPVAGYLGWECYVDHYHEVTTNDSVSFLSHGKDANVENVASCLSPIFDYDSLLECKEAPNIFSALSDCVKGIYPVYPSLVLDLGCNPLSVVNTLLKLYTSAFVNVVKTSCDGRFWWDRMVESEYSHSIQDLIATVHTCVSFPLIQALGIAKENPSAIWSNEKLRSIGRLDLARIYPSFVSESARFQELQDGTIVSIGLKGMMDDSSMEFDLARWGDARFDIVERLLNTSVPVQLPGKRDTIEEFQSILQALTRRTLALPVARGMVTMNTQNFKMRDTLPIPQLNLNGFTPDGLLVRRNAESPDSTTSAAVEWAEFHNGCSSGLRFVNKKSTVTRSWITYQTRESDTPSQAGVLLALGLQCHLRQLRLQDLYAFLTSRREMFTIALVLGLGCTYRGTSNNSIYKCLKMHVSSINDNTQDLEVSIEVQMATLVAIGLLKQGSADRFLTEVLVGEVSRRPSDQHCVHLAGYALSAGISLGLVLLQKGPTNKDVSERLIAFLNGDYRASIPNKTDSLADYIERHQEAADILTISTLFYRNNQAGSFSCNKVIEGGRFNKFVAGPPAAIALALMYIQTDDNDMARLVAPGHSRVEVERLTPEMIMMRVFASSLIGWSSIDPSFKWIFHTTIPSVLFDQFVSETTNGTFKAVESLLVDALTSRDRYLLLLLGFAIGGATLAIGFRYAGSMNSDARRVAINELRGFANGNIGSTGIKMSAWQKTSNVFETCVTCCSISVGLIMAGKGDAAAFSLLRKLHSKTTMSYGGHMAISMAIGLLSLSGGTQTISTSPQSIASLLISLYPIWTDKNTDYIIPLRHMYVLATIPRTLSTKDLATNHSVAAEVKISLRNEDPAAFGDVRKNGSSSNLWSPSNHLTQLPYEKQCIYLTTPCILPEYESIDKIEVRSLKFQPLHVKFSSTCPPVCSPITLGLVQKEGASDALDTTTNSGALNELAGAVERICDLNNSSGRVVLEASSVILFLRTASYISLKSGTDLVHVANPIFPRDTAAIIRKRLDSSFNLLVSEDMMRLVPSCEYHPLYQVLFTASVAQVAKYCCNEIFPKFSYSHAFPSGEMATAKWIKLALLFYGLDKKKCSEFIQTSLGGYNKRSITYGESIRLGMNMAVELDITPSVARLVILLYISV